MGKKRTVDIDAVIALGHPVRESIRRSAYEAMKQYIQAGESMVSGKDGKVVYIPPEELKIMLAEEERRNGPLDGRGLRKSVRPLFPASPGMHSTAIPSCRRSAAAP